MQTNNLGVPFQPCRRRGPGNRVFRPVRLQTVEYLLRFADGGQEFYQVAYTASIEAEKTCREWRYRGHASRRLSIFNRAGERFDNADVDRRVELLPDIGYHAMADWHGEHEYGGEHGPSRQKHPFDAVFERLIKAFAAAIIADKRRVEKQFRQMYPGVEAVSEVG